MAITASMVKELRERTGSAMMDCKKALVETNGDLEAAADHLRKTGLAKAGKKSDRITAEGQALVRTNTDASVAVILEINCETDFVAGGDDFKGFADEVADLVLNQAPADVAALSALSTVAGATVEDARKALVAKIGENITVRRFQRIESNGGAISSYRHGDRIGVLVDVKGGDDELGRDLAMHIAATNPQFLDADEVPAEVLDKEREVLTAQAQDSGKPAEIIAKMIEGRVRKYLAEITFVGQPFVKDDKQTIAQLLKANGASVADYVRLEVGEGIEKQEDNFAEEVMAQVRGD